MLHLIYIGRHAETIERFSKTRRRGSFMPCQLHVDKASEFIDKIREKFDIVILIRADGSSQTDIPDIESLQKEIFRESISRSLAEGFTYTARTIRNT